VNARGLVLAAAVLSASGAQAAPVPPGSVTAGKAKRAIGTGVLNLNTASLDQLDALPGISPKVASAVVAERAARPFSRPEDVMRVRGVSKKRFERLRQHLTVTGATSFVPASGRQKSGPDKVRARQGPTGTHP
jgi:competence ComEA-like helix-hairpin-helix protein